MYHLLYEKQAQWTVQYPDAQLIELAKELNLDIELFEVCLSSREPLERVLGDMYDAQGVAQKTPTFIAVFDGRGAVFEGARPADEFVSLLERLSESAAVGEETK
jgi:predicted DsbA family dithiol-disulfide isomerase